MLSSNSVPLSSPNIQPQTSAISDSRQFWKQIFSHTSNAIFVVVALIVIDGLYNTTPTSQKLKLGTLHEPSVFSLAVEDCCMVNGIFSAGLSDAGDHR
ncbi:MAG: hypothetical protein AAFO04_13990 [Cyanobacteria bacterium J06592_8]